MIELYEAWNKLEKAQEWRYNCPKQKLLKSDKTDVNSFLSEAEKHRQDKVTPCLQNVTTNPKFAYNKSEIMLIFYENVYISKNFLCRIGLSIRLVCS